MTVTHPPVVVRAANLEDLGAPVDVSVGIQQLHPDGRPDLFNEPAREVFEQFMRQRIADDTFLLIAEEREGGAIGYGLAEHVMPAAYPIKTALSILDIRYIAVDPTVQSAGNGKARQFFEGEGFAPVTSSSRSC